MGLEGRCPYVSEALRGWLVATHLELIQDFLDRLSLPHEGCYVQGDPPPPTAPQFAQAITTIRGSHGDRATAFFLGYMTSDPCTELWEQLSEGIR